MRQFHEVVQCTCIRVNARRLDGRVARLQPAAVGRSALPAAAAAAAAAPPRRLSAAA